MNRRQFLHASAVAAAGLGTPLLTGCHATKPVPTGAASGRGPLFRISLAEWSLHRAIFGGLMNNLDFPRVARMNYGIGAIELVSQFFKDRARDPAYLGALIGRARDYDTRMLLIMVDDEGALGDPDPKKRAKAVENHHQWVEAGQFLGCQSIRVNAETGGVGTPQDQQQRVADGLHQLCLYARGYGLNILVENHGGLSSNGAWLAGVMQAVNLPNCGTLPDFGNFNLGDGREYDRYRGVQEMMPYARAVSAKSNDFDAAGDEIHTDFRRMMRIVLGSGYHGFVGIEYEGEHMSEHDGILATKSLLETIRDEFTAQAAGAA